jgi:hypothetical protein
MIVPALWNIILAQYARVAPAGVLEWEHLSALGYQHIIYCPRPNPGVIAVSNLPDQSSHACQILPFGYCPVVPDSVIGHLFRINKAIVKAHHTRCEVYSNDCVSRYLRKSSGHIHL